MGAVIPAVKLASIAGFTASDRDCDWELDFAPDAVSSVNSMPVVDSEAVRTRRCRQMAHSALIMMDRAGVELLDPDFDPWTVGAPAHKGFVEHRAINPSPEQMAFANTIESVRNILTTNATRPLSVFSARQTTSVPGDATLLNLFFYLSATGILVAPIVRRQADGTYLVSVVVE